jgi:hypothetical protein
MIFGFSVRLQVETVLAKIPSALIPAPRMIRPVAANRIKTVDELLRGGPPVRAIRAATQVPITLSVSRYVMLRRRRLKIQV